MTGCRLREILSLEWGWIKGKRIHLPDSKSGPRTVWLSSAARAAINAIPHYGHDCPYLFPARPATRPIDNIEHQWSRIRAEAGLPAFRLHDLRRSWASVAAMNGVDMVTIAKVLGHALVETTERYVHLSDQSVSDAADRVSNRIQTALVGIGAEHGGGTFDADP
ncbi:MAG: site-specific integrase [Deltaproteobacteria bacterium]|nr:site-specific integrase [Deltaproteobacteria bacterium]